MSATKLVIVNDSNFDEKVLQSEQPVLVDFYAEWCSPCRVVAPFLSELADEFKGQVTIAKLDVDQNARAASRFGVRSIPTLILFANGQQKDATVGADPTKIRHLVTSAL